MSEEDLKKIAKKILKEQIMETLDSALIFTYIKNLEEENSKLKEENEFLKELYKKPEDFGSITRN